MGDTLTSLTAGMPIPYGGDQVTHVDEELAMAFAAGDRLVVVQDTGALLHVPAAEAAIAAEAVTAASSAFAALGSVDDEVITAFYHAFADRLADETAFAPIAAANAADVASARRRGRTTTRLELSEKMRADMIAGIAQAWAESSGTNALPGRPTRYMSRSMTNAARAM